MENLEQKIGQILSDPEAMSNILSLAKSLGLTPPENAGETTQPQDPPQPPPAQPAAGFGGIESLLGSLGGGLPGGADLLGALPTVMGLLSEAEKVDTKQAALWNALKPFLRPDRREKVDKAMRIARLSHVANYALKNWDLKV